MNKGQKIILIGIVIILLIFTSIGIFLSLNNKDEKNSETGNYNNNINNDINFGNDENYITDNFVRLDNENRFFTLQNIINQHMESITINFIAKDIYYNSNSRIIYYFINGYTLEISNFDNSYKYEKDVNYLIIVKNNKYELKKLPSNIDILNYAKNYKLQDIEINNNNIMPNEKITEKNKLITYINEFLNLLYMDTGRAYNMLDNNTKNKYDSYTSFETSINTIYDTISATVFAYAVEEYDDYKEYRIKDNYQNSITITEYHLMDYKIGF